MDWSIWRFIFREATYIPTTCPTSTHWTLYSTRHTILNQLSFEQKDLISLELSILLEYEALLLKSVSRLNVSFVIFKTRISNDAAFSLFMRESSLKHLTLRGLNPYQATQLKYVRNLESITLCGRNNAQINFSTLSHLCHISNEDSFMNLESIFGNTNNITSIHINSRSQDLDKKLLNSKKLITSPEISQFSVMKKHYDASIFTNLLTNSISSLKHLLIRIHVEQPVIEHFLNATRVLESITIYSSRPMKFLEYAHGIKDLELHMNLMNILLMHHLIHFIQRQTKLESFVRFIIPIELCSKTSTKNILITWRITWWLIVMNFWDFIELIELIYHRLYYYFD